MAVHKDPLAAGERRPDEKDARDEISAQVELWVVLGGHDEVAHARNPFLGGRPRPYGVSAPRAAACLIADLGRREAHNFCDSVFPEKLPVARPAPSADKNVRIDLRGGVARWKSRESLGCRVLLGLHVG